MKIDNDSYYIRHDINKDGGEITNMTHFIKVWYNGFMNDTYFFYQNRISFEDAVWTGVNPDNCHTGKRILKRCYDRWEKRIKDCKNNIESIAKNKSFPFENNWNVGDYLYFPYKEILAELDRLEGSDLLDDDENYDSPDLCLVHITNKNGDTPVGTTIHIDKYECWNDTEEKTLECYLDDMDKAFCISKEVYNYASNLISNVSSEIIIEIAQTYKK